jgi:hypothetical protein
LNNACYTIIRSSPWSSNLTIRRSSGKLIGVMLAMRLRTIGFILLILATFVITAACRNRNAALGIDEVAITVCNETCARHGQCGTLADGRKAVLANLIGPAVSLHDRFFEDGTQVMVNEISDRELIAARDSVPLYLESTPFPHTFYRVTAGDKTAWVSQWCLERP